MAAGQAAVFGQLVCAERWNGIRRAFVYVSGVFDNVVLGDFAGRVCGISVEG